jgi:maltose alpha-D-glucosyltransferase/alpha-amylase
MPRIYMALAQANATPIIEILTATPQIPEDSQWCTFLRNHDELTLEMVTPEEREYMWETYAPTPRMRQNLGIRRRLAPLLDNDQHKIELLNALLFSLPGSPILYYGDEIGMGDNIWLDDRDGVRTPMQWEEGPNAGFAPAAVKPEQLYAPLIEEAPYSFRQVNVEAQRDDPSSLWHALRRMIAVRRVHPAFGCSNYAFLPTESRAVLAVLRLCEGETILALHNLSPQAQPVKLDLRKFAHNEAENLLFARPLPLLDDGFASLTLLPYEYVWVKLT